MAILTFLFPFSRYTRINGFAKQVTIAAVILLCCCEKIHASAPSSAELLGTSTSLQQVSERGNQSSKVERTAISEISGSRTLCIPLETAGGVLLPNSRAIFALPEGAVAIELMLSEFPSRTTLVDFGQGAANRITITESFRQFSGSGSFQFSVWDGDGVRRTIESELRKAGHVYLLSFSYGSDGFTFYIDGEAVGTIEGAFHLLPARLAIAEPVGVNWQKIGLWAERRNGEQFRRLVAREVWQLDEKTTFLAIRDTKKGGPQTALIGSALVSATDAKEILEGQAPGREYFVDGARGNDNSDGTKTAPLKTLGRASALVRAGDTVEVAPGIYRESIALTASGTPTAPIRFKASNAGPVVIDGTDPIEGFRSLGTASGMSLWVKSGFQTRDQPYGDAKQRTQLERIGPGAVKQLERRGRLDVLWCDDSILLKAESFEQLRVNSFWVDKTKGELVLALRADDRPENHRLEIGARGPLVSGAVSHIHIQGFQLSRDNSPLFKGAIELEPTSTHWHIDNITERGGNWSGIRLGGWGHILRNNVWEHNGDVGIDGSLLQNVVIDGDAVRFNNWQRGISPAWGAGGVKLTQADNVTIRNFEAAFNLGPGIWFDCNNKNITIEDSRSHHNESGIFMEISPGPFAFRNNTCFANSGAGILVGESYGGLIEGNTLVGNLSGIELRNIPGRDEKYGGAGCGLIEPGVSWKTKDIMILRNVLAENRVAGIINTHRALDVGEDQIKSDFNLFFKNMALHVWPAPDERLSGVKMNADSDWAIPRAEGLQIKMTSLNAIHQFSGIEIHSIEKSPQFSYPTAYEYEVGVELPSPN